MLVCLHTCVLPCHTCVGIYSSIRTTQLRCLSGIVIMLNKRKYFDFILKYCTKPPKKVKSVRRYLCLSNQLKSKSVRRYLCLSVKRVKCQALSMLVNCHQLKINSVRRYLCLSSKRIKSVRRYLCLSYSCIISEIITSLRTKIY